MQNYHKHTSYSNIMTPDSAASYEDYAKRAVELGHKVITSKNAKNLKRIEKKEEN